MFYAYYPLLKLDHCKRDRLLNYWFNSTSILAKQILNAKFVTNHRDFDDGIDPYLARWENIA